MTTLRNEITYRDESLLGNYTFLRGLLLRSKLVLESLKLIKGRKSASNEGQDGEGTTPVHECALLISELALALLTLIEELDLRAAATLIA